MRFQEAPQGKVADWLISRFDVRRNEKREKEFEVGDEIELINANTGKLATAKIREIDTYTGRIVAVFENYPIPAYFASVEALRNAVDEAGQQQEELPLDKTPVTAKRQFQHVGYSALASPEHVREYEGRERITSRTESVQGKVYLPDMLVGSMEGIVVDYEKDFLLRHYLEMKMLPYILSQNGEGHRHHFAATIQLICQKIADDFPYQYKMLDREYCRQRYSPGQKVSLGLIMQRQDLVCRHMGLLFAVTIDFLKKHSTEAQTGIPMECDVRFMADTQRDLVEEKRDGHAYCVMQRHQDYYVVDPTKRLAEDVRKILYSHNEGTSKYRYLFSALRCMLQSSNFGNGQLAQEVVKQTKVDLKLHGLIEDVRKTIEYDAAATHRLLFIEGRTR